MEDTTTLPSMWTSINNWCTPTFLFLFLNFMIATILFTSNLPNNNNNNQTKQQNQKTQTQTQNEADNNKLGRSPSILNRLRSFNLHAYRSPNDQQQQVQVEEQDALELAATQYVFDHPFPRDQQEDPQSIPVSSKPDLDPTHFAQTNVVQPPPSKPIISNAQTHFVYDRHTIEKITTHYDFGPTHIENEPPEPTHFSFDRTHQKSIENKQEKKTHFKFDPTHLEKTQEKTTHIENEPENPTQDDFDPTHEEEEEEENDSIQSLDEVYSIITGGGHVKRTKSDTVPASGEVPVKLPAKMKKSASMKSPFSHFEEEKIVEARRPETVRERRTTAVVDGDDDVEVDAKADDFINKFKQQLKLQRLDSIIRYKDTVNRGGEK